MTNDKFRVAMIIPGGIGTGKDNIGVPVLERLIKLLSLEFDITVFSLFRINADYTSDTFELVDVSSHGTLATWSDCYKAFRVRHNKNPFVAIHGFWAMPSGFLAVLFGKLFRIKSVVSVLGGDAIALPEIKYGQLQKPLSRNLIRWTLRHATQVTALTKYLRDNLSKAGMNTQNLEIIPWGIDVSLFNFHAKEISHPVQFLHIANLHPVKDPFTLLKSFKIISDKVDARLKIIGDGILSAEVKALVHELGLTHRVVFTDPLPYEELPFHYKVADILLHTSLSEGQSEVVTEAMSSGVVVCGTAVGLIYDEPAHCISVGVGDYELLAIKVFELLNEPERLKTIREGARSWAVAHDIQWTARMYGKLYGKA